MQTGAFIKHILKQLLLFQAYIFKQFLTCIAAENMSCYITFEHLVWNDENTKRVILQVL